MTFTCIVVSAHTIKIKFDLTKFMNIDQKENFNIYYVLDFIKKNQNDIAYYRTIQNKIYDQNNDSFLSVYQSIYFQNEYNDYYNSFLNGSATIQRYVKNDFSIIKNGILRFKSGQNKNL